VQLCLSSQSFPLGHVILSEIDPAPESTTDELLGLSIQIEDMNCSILPTNSAWSISKDIVSSIVLGATVGYGSTYITHGHLISAVVIGGSPHGSLMIETKIRCVRQTLDNFRKIRQSRVRKLVILLRNLAISTSHKSCSEYSIPFDFKDPFVLHALSFLWYLISLDYLPHFMIFHFG
jgi:hypothetical protein